MVTSVSQYAVLRFIAGVGLAGELGAGITLVSELLPKEKRGIAAAMIASFGILGAVTGSSGSGGFFYLDGKEGLLGGGGGLGNGKVD